MKEYFYEIDLSRSVDNSCHISGHNLGSIEVIATPDSPGEHKNKWTPDHLLAAAVSSDFMATFLQTAAKINLDILTYTSQCFVRMEKVQGKFTTAEILLRPVIKLKSGFHVLKAYQCAEEAEYFCSTRNALKINVNIHPNFQYSPDKPENPEL